MIDIRITSPTKKGLDSALNALEANFILSKKSLPYPFRNHNTGETKLTVYVSISKWRR